MDSSSNFPEYLALVIWYHVGQKDILSIQVRQVFISIIIKLFLFEFLLIYVN